MKEKLLMKSITLNKQQQKQKCNNNSTAIAKAMTDNYL